MAALEILLFAMGFTMAAAVVLSAVRTVAVPRGEQVLLSKALFTTSRHVFRAMTRLARTPESKEAFRARMAPMTMLLMPFVWALGVILGYSLMFWALGVRPYKDALVLSGSSFTTLGFRSTTSFVEMLLAISEALLGLGLVALLISFMPSLYGAFSRREALVSRLEVRAGHPPSPEEHILRAHRIGWLESLDTWAHWEQWFIEVEEAHTTYPALNFFRSPVPGRSWITSSATVLDSASLMQSTVAVPNSAEASLCIRAGYVALRRIADYFELDHPQDPGSGDAIAIKRSEFDGICDRLAAEGVPIVEDRDQAWADFVGWRVNYDQALIAICSMVEAPPGTWTTKTA
ncbi:MAG: hypothetical protein ACR2PK_17590 [Acidimicrobiales bacterium]